MAVIAAAGKMGVSSDELCAQAVGGLMFEHHWGWANAQYAQGSADEIDNALSLLVGKPPVQNRSSAIEAGSNALLNRQANRRPVRFI
ncbi:hypothetical protein [Pseudomonas fluorescens]|uniref:Uncharacterized protein n=1 Tax=Pseudomonas fluorescens TaxID=294 RepID=A0A944HK66_PSEFL|nr:hypothetical protein [Pseudomonas fluorescens]MBT2296048.1 hypothetical protein [Pseudomonas fluorescens]MBT2308309.1 hypothetical protein [Pseudomonas fluorescens]MBT2313520.1 hypothetical protein [Pseudomonas fluorescens]MBT2320259.1 hypothetical protein [Pseudomonas fluorescens]MBT2330643.1 hypothetical protein [Pseudomonas fluorescens]